MANAQTQAPTTSFYRSMDSRERNTFWACFLGWGLDGFDFMIYPLVIGTLMAMWQVSAGEAGLATTVTLLASAVGGWMAGYLSDRIGRVLTLQITIAWFATFSLLCAFAQGFDQLLIFRALLGIGFGGEWAAGAVLMGEIIRADHRGKALGAVQSAWAVGWGLAVLLQAAAFSFFGPEIAWRVMFAAGFVPSLVLIYFIYKKVPEPEIARQVRLSSVKKPPIWQIFGRSTLRRTLLASTAMVGAQGGYYAINTWLPVFLQQERGLSVVGTGPYLAFLIGGSFTGYLVGAWLADRIGRRMLFLTFSLGAIAIVVIYTQVAVLPVAFMFLGFPLGFFSSGYLSGVGAFLTELFPTRVRGSAQGFCYNFGRGIGALFPTAVGFLAMELPLGSAIAIFATAAYVLFFMAAFALPETRGTTLVAD